MVYSMHIRLSMFPDIKKINPDISKKKKMLKNMHHMLKSDLKYLQHIVK